MARGRALRIFFDTNVIFSALYSPASVPAELLRGSLMGTVCWVTSPLVLEEIVRNVRQKLPGSEEALRALLGDAELEVVPNATATRQAALSPILGPDDASIVAAAAAAEVDFFVTGDQRVLTECRSLALSRPEFLSPRELLDRIESNKGEIAP